MAKSKDYEQITATTYLSVNTLSLFANGNDKLRKVSRIMTIWLGLMILVFGLTVALSTATFVTSLPGLSHVIHVEVYKWTFLLNAGLCVLILVVWVFTGTVYKSLSSTNRITISATILCYVFYTAVGTARIFCFDSFYDLDRVTKAQLLVDLQLGLSWSDTLSIICLFGYIVSIFSIGSICVTMYPETAPIRHNAAATKEMLSNSRQ